MRNWASERLRAASVLREYFPSSEHLARAIRSLLPSDVHRANLKDATGVLGGRIVVRSHSRGRSLRQRINELLVSGRIHGLMRPEGIGEPAELTCELVYLDKVRGKSRRGNRTRRVGLFLGAKGELVKPWERDDALCETYRSLQQIVAKYLPGFSIVAPPRRRRGFRPAPARAGSAERLRTYAPLDVTVQPPFRNVGGDRYMVFVQRDGTRRPARSITIARGEAKIISMQG